HWVVCSTKLRALSAPHAGGFLISDSRFWRCRSPHRPPRAPRRWSAHDDFIARQLVAPAIVCVGALLIGVPLVDLFGDALDNLVVAFDDALIRRSGKPVRRLCPARGHRARGEAGRSFTAPHYASAPVRSAALRG